MAQEGELGTGEQRGLARQAALGHIPRTARALHPGITLQDREGSGYCSSLAPREQTLSSCAGGEKGWRREEYGAVQEARLWGLPAFATEDPAGLSPPGQHQHPPNPHTVP